MDISNDIKTYSTKKITVNGQQYSDLDQIPEPFRKYLQDRNKNGLPDFAEDGNSGDWKVNYISHVKADIEGLPFPIKQILGFIINNSVDKTMSSFPNLSSPQKLPPDSSGTKAQYQSPVSVDSSQFESARKYLAYLLFMGLVLYLVVTYMLRNTI